MNNNNNNNNNNDDNNYDKSYNYNNNKNKTFFFYMPFRKKVMLKNAQNFNLKLYLLYFNVLNFYLHLHCALNV